MPPTSIILTGGPSTGKTSLLKKLSEYGFQTIPEEARRIIKEQIEQNGDGLPWKNKERYSRLMIEASIATYNKVLSENSEVFVFFDRGIPDAIGYMEMESIPIGADMISLAETHRYHKTVFLFPAWKEIYTTDAERKQDWEEVRKTVEKMREIYNRFGYEVIEVPKTTVEERAKFILEKIGL